MSDPSKVLAWLVDRPPRGAWTGYYPEEWPAATWVLHAMYENPHLRGLGTHDDLHRRRLASGEIESVIVNGINLESVGYLSGTSHGFVGHPGRPWRRVTWEQYQARFSNFTPKYENAPGLHWFPRGSWPVSVQPPPEGSLDEESFKALTVVLADHSPQGLDTRCFAFYAHLPARDWERVHLWEGPLGHVQYLISDNGGLYDFSPTNLWDADRGWLVSTDYDLQGTQVNGDQALIDDVLSHPNLECRDWEPPDPQ